MVIRKFVAFEPISEPDCKSHNHQRRISVTCGRKHRASRYVKTRDLMNLTISVYDFCRGELDIRLVPEGCARSINWERQLKSSNR